MIDRCPKSISPRFERVTCEYRDTARVVYFTEISRPGYPSQVDRNKRRENQVRPAFVEK